MKKIGLIGGLSWVSSAEYYRIINEQVNARLGGLQFAECLLYSVNYADVKKLTDAGDFEALARLMNEISLRLVSAGADCILMCANTMHLVADQVQETIGVPLIHIAEATADAIAAKGLKRVGLLGTRFTMEGDFFKEKLTSRNIATLVPEANDRNYIHDRIYDELWKEIIRPETKSAFLRIIDDLAEQGAEGIILGCTEIPLLIQQSDCRLPLFDTGLLHAEAAVNFAFGEADRP